MTGVLTQPGEPEEGVTLEQVRAFLDAHPRFSSGLHKPPHAAAGSAADIVMQVAPLLKTTRWERTKKAAESAVKTGAEALRQSPQAISATATRAAAKAQEIAGWIKENVRTYRESRASV